MRIAILTSSRADWGIYLPLAKALKSDKYFDLKIISFGTHLSDFYGKTINEIINNGFKVDFTIESILATDSPSSISTAMGLTMIKFGDFWKEYCQYFDLVFCIGDRFEMFAAVSAGIPFNIKFAHLHGGETTLGAIDNIFRHSISLASKIHFTSTESHAQYVSKLIGTNDGIYNVGAISLDNLKQLELLSIEEFKDKWGVDLLNKTILVTFHPETVDLDSNRQNVSNLIAAIDSLSEYQFIITMPNADTAGNLIRTAFKHAFDGSKNVFLIENLGSQSYFSALKYVSFLLGNTSSGIIEAASFNKYVINLGKRQLGRTSGANVIHTQIQTSEILRAVSEIEQKEILMMQNIYYNGGATNKILDALKKELSYD
ncbi:UDP-N-acetylglucosamine 2-epimerase (hydrolyzing) [Pedobacter panaciterrae]|uniref:UDP-N-acetylglucosamine 2-epimerase n=1 Tax=Pedobacter panaciterrae TaxID=363849 RepID=UPI00155DC75F|nr:UDP-N-acetylglucosamine 2-epimerase [Pedobacter panaciterrae]NQX55254.1 UDP-N-acetylglucosamine 2-epimerase (hydrolyzing) [Pedobacter panaciterrae]